jgi:hypothetical protein
MARQSDKRGVLVVEGESDKRFYARISDRRWQIYSAGTRKNVPPVVGESQQLGVDRIAGLIDRDFDNYFESLSATGLPVFSYTEADLEACLVRTSWFEDLMSEYGSPAKISEQGGIPRLREQIYEAARIVGNLRRANAKFGWGIRFEELKIAKKIDKATLTLSIEPLIAAAKSHITDPDNKPRCTVETVRSVISGDVEFRGRDALLIAIVALRRLYGSCTIKEDQVEVLAKALRLAADSKFLAIHPMPEVSGALASIEQQS